MGTYQAVLIAGCDTVEGSQERVAALSVGGLSLLHRAARAAYRAGASKLLILAPDDATLRAPLARDPHTPIDITWHTHNLPLSQAVAALRDALALIDPQCWLLPVDQVVSPLLFIDDPSSKKDKEKDKKKDPEKDKKEKSKELKEDEKDKKKDKDKKEDKDKDKKDKKWGKVYFSVLEGDRKPKLALVERSALEGALALDAQQGSIDALVGRLMERGRAVAVDGKSAVWAEVRDQAQGARAMDKLMGALRKPLGRDADGVVAYYINRPLSLMMSRRLVNTKLTPNQVTAFALVLGILAGRLVAPGGWVWLVLGGLFLQISSILDGVDGELARLRLTMSKSGEWFDTVCDDIINLGFMFGLAQACSARLASGWPTLFGGAVLVVGGVLVVLIYVDLIRAGVASHNAFKWGFEDAKQSTNTGIWTRVVVVFSYIAKRDAYNLLMALLLVLDLPLVAFLLMSCGTLLITGGYIVQKVGTWKRGLERA